LLSLFRSVFRADVMKSPEPREGFSPVGGASPSALPAPRSVLNLLSYLPRMILASPVSDFRTAFSRSHFRKNPLVFFPPSPLPTLDDLPGGASSVDPAPSPLMIQSRAFDLFFFLSDEVFSSIQQGFPTAQHLNVGGGLRFFLTRSRVSFASRALSFSFRLLS